MVGGVTHSGGTVYFGGRNTEAAQEAERKREEVEVGELCREGRRRGRRKREGRAGGSSSKGPPVRLFASILCSL